MRRLSATKSFLQREASNTTKTKAGMPKAYFTVSQGFPVF